MQDGPEHGGVPGSSDRVYQSVERYDGRLDALPFHPIQHFYSSLGVPTLCVRIDEAVVSLNICCYSIPDGISKVLHFQRVHTYSGSKLHEPNHLIEVAFGDRNLFPRSCARNEGAVRHDRRPQSDPPHKAKYHLAIMQISFIAQDFYYLETISKEILILSLCVRE